MKSKSLVISFIDCPLYFDFAINETTDALVIKVAKDNSGAPLKLTTDEYNSLQTYLAKLKFVGTTIQLISDDADVF